MTPQEKALKSMDIRIGKQITPLLVKKGLDIAVKEVFKLIKLNYTEVKGKHGNYKTISEAKINILKSRCYL